MTGRLSGYLEVLGGGRQASVSQSLCQTESDSFSISVSLGLPPGQNAGVYLQAIQHMLGAGPDLAHTASQRSCRSVTWRAESTGRCLMTLGEIQDIERGVKVQGGR